MGKIGSLQGVRPEKNQGARKIIFSEPDPLLLLLHFDFSSQELSYLNLFPHTAMLSLSESFFFSPFIYFYCFVTYTEYQTFFNLFKQGLRVHPVLTLPCPFQSPVDFISLCGRLVLMSKLINFKWLSAVLYVFGKRLKLHLCC